MKIAGASQNMDEFDGLSWPIEKLAEAVAIVARRNGIASSLLPAFVAANNLNLDSEGSLERWIESLARRVGLEAEAVELQYMEMETFVSRIGPALLRLPGKCHPRFLVVLGGKRRKILVLSPDLSVRKVDAALISGTLCRELESPLAGEVTRLLIEVGISKRRFAKARKALLSEQLGQKPITGCWLLRFSPGRSFWQQARLSKLPQQLVMIFALHLCQYLIAIGAWWIIGEAAFGGRLNDGWLLAWALLLVTAIPFQLMAVWSEGIFSIGIGSLLKQRLLYGALRIEPEKIRRQSSGQFLSQISEASAVEALSLKGGFLGLSAIAELMIAMMVLATGANSGLFLFLLSSWIILTLLLTGRYFRRRRMWTLSRLRMTGDLTERMIGHRTRLAQEARAQWHAGEDQVLEDYLEQSTAMDRLMVKQSLLQRGWIVLGLVGVSHTIISHVATPAQMALSLGGILLAGRGLGKLIASISALSSAIIAWQQVSGLFRAAANPEEMGLSIPRSCNSQQQPIAGRTILKASDVVFRYRGEGLPVLSGCNLQIHGGDRLLLEGASGCGKSTLASILAGLRKPESGLLLLDGLDLQTWGTLKWRERVILVPQFHENHVFTGTFAYNLLMGRDWPPKAEDFDEAEAICDELGLSGLLNRMPSGLMQIVGETGWQLSHGERSRLYLARALLQESDLMILDESFAALDAEILQQCLRCVLKRAKSLLVIAHP